jgi:hypothetical protein
MVYLNMIITLKHFNNTNYVNELNFLDSYFKVNDFDFAITLKYNTIKHILDMFIISNNNLS